VIVHARMNVHPYRSNVCVCVCVCVRARARARSCVMRACMYVYTSVSRGSGGEQHVDFWPEYQQHRHQWICARGLGPCTRLFKFEFVIQQFSKQCQVRLPGGGRGGLGSGERRGRVWNCLNTRNTHTYVHIHTYTLTHTYMLTHTDTLTHTYTLTHT
jgi:hypothetical protein